MEQQANTVVLVCGLPGAGKTTYALELVRRGYVRLSIDEVVWQRLGQRDAGLVLEGDAFDRLKEEVRREQREQLVELNWTNSARARLAHCWPTAFAAATGWNWPCRRGQP